MGSLTKEQIHSTAVESARLIGGLEPQIIQDIIVGLYDKHLAYHGIKRLLSVDGIRQNGVYANCRDTYPAASFWNSGTKIFNGINDGFTSFDTSFFHYSHAAQPYDTDTLVMAAALASKDTLKQADANLTDKAFESGYFSVIQLVKPDGLTIVEASVLKDFDADPRTNAASAERVMLGALYRIVTE